MGRREEMAALLARRERDGLSLRQLSEKSGIPFGTLSWWTWRLRQLTGTEQGSDGGFVEVVAADQHVDGGVVVRLDSGLEVAVRPGTDAGWVREIVAALRSC
jgi:hypothetical protein